MQQACKINQYKINTVQIFYIFYVDTNIIFIYKYSISEIHITKSLTVTINKCLYYIIYTYTYFNKLPHFLIRSSVTQMSLIFRLCCRACASSSWYSPMVDPPMWHNRPIHLRGLSCCSRRRTVARVTVVETLNQISWNEIRKLISYNILLYNQKAPLYLKRNRRLPISNIIKEGKTQSFMPPYNKSSLKHKKHKETEENMEAAENQLTYTRQLL